MKSNVLRIYVILIFTGSFINSTLGQNYNDFIPKIIPPSPNAASLGRYGEISVGYYSGVPSISIPIYSIKAGTITLPLTLNYNASGVRVAEEASWVGLGWSLNSGGVISRNIIGKDDFLAGGYYNNPIVPGCQYGVSYTYGNQQHTEYYDITHNLKDNAPDEFTYNFSGYSGKMVYFKDKNKFVPLKQENFKIDFDPNTEKWTIVTIDGVKYIFGVKEITNNFSASSGGGELIVDDIPNPAGYGTTAWYLESVTSPQGDVINFIYDNIYHQTSSIVRKSETYYSVSKVRNGYDCNLGTFESISVSPDGYVSGYADMHSACQTVVDDVYLKEIRTSNGLKVSFITEDRIDIRTKNANKPQRLIKLTITHDGSSQVKEYELHQSYFSNGTNNYKNLRLRLDSVTVKGNGNSSIPPYVFKYYEGSLPAKDSKSIDHWGYYNGAPNDNCISDWDSGQLSGTLIPSTTVLQTDHTPYAPLTFRGADRSPNGEFSMRATLSQIEYPTGGTTKFVFEPNRYVDFYGTKTVSETLVDITASRIEGDQIENTTATASLTIPSNGYGGEWITILFNAYSPTNPKTCDPNSNKLTYTFPGISQDAIFGQVGGTVLKYNNWNITCGIPIGEDKIKVFLASGVYSVNLDPVFDGFRASLKVISEKSVAVADEVSGGGLRIKEIISNNGKQDNIKRYEYYGVGTSTSGMLMTPIYYHYMFNTGGSFFGTFNVGSGGAPPSFGSGDIFIAGSSSIVSSGGTIVGYSKVTEYNNSNEVAGKTIYSYKNTPEVFVLTNFVPGKPNSLNNSNGLLSTIEYYSANGELVKRIVNDYEVSSNSYEANGIAFTTTLPMVETCADFPLAVACYDYKTEWWRKKNETSESYYTGSFARTETNYVYDESNMLVKEQYSQTSEGKTLLYRTFFAQNAPTETITAPSIFQTMKDRNMIGLPVKQEIWVNSKQSKGIITNYGDNLLPSIIQTLEKIEYTPRLYFDQYDDVGNITQFHEVDNLVTSVVWGYKKSLPFIQAKNADYASLKAVVSVALVNSGYSEGFNGLDLFLNDISNLSLPTQRAKLTALVNAVNSHSLLKNARVEFVTHDPLIGITSHTDINGKTTYYEYDSMGRLEVMRDWNLDILQNYIYNYKK